MLAKKLTQNRFGETMKRWVIIYNGLNGSSIGFQWEIREHLGYLLGTDVSCLAPPPKKENRVPSGKLTSYRKSPFILGKSTVNDHFQ
jgi:hypothetical protein